MGEVDKELCDEKHDTVNKRLDEHDKILSEHTKDISDLKGDNKEFKSDIKHLCENIESLTITLRWFMGLMIGSFVAFFFYAVQQIIFK